MDYTAAPLEKLIEEFGKFHYPIASQNHLR